MIPQGNAFDPSVDIPSLAGKRIFITGGTSGLGAASLVALAAHGPEHIYFTGRNRVNAMAVIDRVKTLHPAVSISFIALDHTRLGSIRCALETFCPPRIDVLMCNAGIMASPAMPTADGYEIQFGVNYLAHALIIRVLLPILLRTQKEHGVRPRIVIQTSEAYMLHAPGGICFQRLRAPQYQPVWGAWVRFGQSHLANILLAAELARRHPSILAVAVQPGISDTDLVRSRAFLDRVLIYATNKVKTPDEGARTQLWAAASCRYPIENGEYYQAVGVLGWHVRESRNVSLAGKLWAWTSEALRPFV